MAIFILTFALFSVAVLVMAAGVLISGRSLKGSCGGPSCKCVSDGKDLGACDFSESTLPAHPVSNQ